MPSRRSYAGALARGIAAAGATTAAIAMLQVSASPERRLQSLPPARRAVAAADGRAVLTAARLLEGRGVFERPVRILTMIHPNGSYTIEFLRTSETSNPEGVVMRVLKSNSGDAETWRVEPGEIPMLHPSAAHPVDPRRDDAVQSFLATLIRSGAPMRDLEFTVKSGRGSNANKDPFDFVITVRPHELDSPLREYGVKLSGAVTRSP
jgi:hypothetical protein